MHSRTLLLTLLFLSVVLALPANADTTAVIPQPSVSEGAPVVIDADTLLRLHSSLGPFSAEQRASAVNGKLVSIVRNPETSADSVGVAETASTTNLILNNSILMAVTDEDAAPLGKSRQTLAVEYALLLTSAIRTYQNEYSARSLMFDGATSLGLLIGVILAFWLMRRVFARIYDRIESWEGKLFRSISFRSHVILSAETITSSVIVLMKGIRLAITLGIIYFFLTYVLGLFPWTKSWNVRPILGGLLSVVLVTVAAGALVKGSNAFFRVLKDKIPSWRGTLIKPVRIKTMEVLSAERLTDMAEFGVKVLHFAVLITIGYIYITFAFSFFAFTRTWAATLFSYVTDPLITAIVAFVKYLPNLFYIAVISFLTLYVTKFIKLAFTEIERGTISLPGFYGEWAQPTFKIVRFLILAFAVIVIFPYLPGSDSPAFQGVSVFIGVLFSLGSTSAIANIVAGVVLTYMRPFKIGDRVKIADTMGDVVEKTLLVTRVRTIKNVDITIPNAMVLGSHIINFSSSAKDKGLILHTTVTIGYDVPWKQVHGLLLGAADTTSHILKDPKPFVLQTSLDDFYVSYELNAITDNPGIMARIYSELHQNIQDKFNEGGVEILSPHYAAMRDGNQVTTPPDYLPKTYEAPGFRLFPLGGFFDKPKSE